MRRGRNEHLTADESAECTAMILAGAKAREIAARFNIAERTAQVRMAKALGRPSANSARYVKPRREAGVKKPALPAPKTAPGISVERLMGRRA